MKTNSFRLFAVLSVLSLAMAGVAFAEAGDAAKKMAAAHRTAAECLDSGKPLAECHAAFEKTCEEHCKSEGGECMMGGKHKHHHKNKRRAEQSAGEQPQIDRPVGEDAEPARESRLVSY